MFVKQKIRPRFKPRRIVSDILRVALFPSAFGRIQRILEILTGFNGGAAFLRLPRLAVFLTLVRGEIVEVEIGVAAHNLLCRGFKHREPGAGFIEEVAQFGGCKVAHGGVRLVYSEDDVPSLSGFRFLLEVGDYAAELRCRISGERIGFALDIVNLAHSYLILRLPGNHLVNKVNGVVCHSLCIPEIALYGLQFGHDVL